MTEQSAEQIRFAIYVSIYDEILNDPSVETQIDHCKKEIEQRGGTIIGIYSDNVKSDPSLNRNGFMEMRDHAAKGNFDAIMFWKFDRLAHIHDHVDMIKVMLQHEYGLKLYCVDGSTEDDNDSPYVVMMVQLLEIFSAFYSKNLSNEIKRGKL